MQDLHDGSRLEVNSGRAIFDKAIAADLENG